MSDLSDLTQLFKTVNAVLKQTGSTEGGGSFSNNGGGTTPPADGE